MQINKYTVYIREYEIRYEDHNRRRHMIIPTVMMVPGVHHGSNGPLFHSAEELSKHPSAWNGEPVVIRHPSIDGISVSANTPEIIDQEQIGRIYNAVFDGKLKAEVWLDELRLQSQFPEIYEWIIQGKALDVSVGVFTDDEIVNGIWNGEEYAGISRNHRPDHCAILPPGVNGACGWNEGCGLRANQSRGDDSLQAGSDELPRNQEGGNDVPLLKDGKIDLTDQNITVLKELVAGGYNLIVNETGLRERVTAIQRQLDGMDTDGQVHFLEEAYTSYFVYRKESREGGMSLDGAGSALYKQPYSIDKDGIVEFGAQPIPVVRKVKYVEKSQTLNNEGGTEEMADKKKTPCCPEKVELLVQSATIEFGEEDREMLSGLDEKVIDSFLAMDTANADLVTQAAELEAKIKEVPKDPPRKISKAPEMNKEQAMQVLKDQLTDPVKFLQLLPPEVRAQMEYGMELYQDHRQELVTQVLENAPDGVYTEDELKGMDEYALDKLARVVPSKVDYSAFNAGNLHENKVQPLLPPGVKEAAAA